MAAPAIGDVLHQRRTFPGARPFHRPADRGVDSVQIVAVRRLARHAIARRPVGDARDGKGLAGRVGHGVLVVLTDEHYRQRPDGRHVERLVKWSAVGRAVAKETETDSSRPLHFLTEADTNCDGDAAGHDAVGAQVAAGHVSDVHGAAAAAAVARFLAHELGHHAVQIGPLGDAVAVAAMGAEDVVVGLQRGHRTDGRGFHADAQVHRAVDLALRVQVLGLLFEGADQPHLAQQVALSFRG